MTEGIGQIFRGLFGLAFAFGILAFIYKRHAEEWDVLSRAYGRKWKAPIQQKTRRSLVLYREGRPARTYAGIVTIGVYETGIGLKPIRILSPFHAPVFIPFSDIQGWKQSWYLDGASAELMFARAPELQMIMPEAQVTWISSVGQSGIALSDNHTPRENWPWATRAMAVMGGLMALTMIGMWALGYLNF